MNLTIGIVGLPNVGKSTLFNALTRNSVPAENYPFCTIDPTVGIVPVPDPRLYTLSEISNSQDTIPAVVEFVDIAGLVKGASTGEGLGNKFLSNIREVDMILEVVRIFDDEDIHHVAGVVDPMADIEIINLELILADQETVAKRRDHLERDVKRGMSDAIKEHELLSRLLTHLESGHMAKDFVITDEEKKMYTSLHLLTQKPVLYACNKKHGAYNLDENNDERWIELMEFISSGNNEHVVIDAGTEHELKDLNDEDKNEFRREYGSQNSGIDALIRSAYHMLGLISFFTTGEKETRAWTIGEESLAPIAGAAIHTDFQEKFIRTQVVAFEDLVASGSIAKARENGKLRTEGKEYVVQDGDVMEFLHS